MPIWTPQTRAWSLKLTHFFSQTDTSGERDFGPFLKEALLNIPYFQNNPGFLRLEKTLSDPLERCVVLALVKGRSPQTIILTGHYDVVGIENYGALQPWACNPEALLPRLIETLQFEQNNGLSPSDQLALDDLLSGNYLPGRGLLDMKSGLAAGLAVLEHYSQLPLEERPGSLLFIAVPDEEIASNGARTAGALLPNLSKTWNLQFETAINLDASDDHGDGSQGQVAYLGSVGKLLPSVYLVGRETHAGSPFSGINATLLASELTRLIECNPDLCDSVEGVFSAPPTCLKQVDSKTHYDVTTPITAWCYYNWLTLQRPVDDVLETLRRLTSQALEAAAYSVQSSARQFSEISHQLPILPDWRPQVYMYAEVKKIALQKGGSVFEKALEKLEQELGDNPELDSPTCNLRLIEAVWNASGLTGPAAVIGFAAIFYPPVLFDPSSERTNKLHQAIMRQAQKLSQKLSIPISTRPFFPGISDISFLGGRVTAHETQLLAANTPAWKTRARFNYTEVTNLGIPSVNIGPWGRDYHQRLERVYTPYAFEVLPEFLWLITQDLFGL